jgi:hypothetical protein
MSRGAQSSAEAILRMKCPRCRKGDLFCRPTSFNFQTLPQMPAQCAHCSQSFEPEPGFYYGAMYINYAFSVVLLGVCVFFLLYFKMDPYVIFGMFIGFVLLLGPWMFRYSRVVYLNFFVHFDPAVNKPNHLD